MSARVLFWVQHLVGVGHQRRSAAIARAMAGQGMEVHYVSGGMPVANLALGDCAFHQLPPARSVDMRYHTLVDDTGAAVDEHWRVRRCQQLLDLFHRLEPDAVITETWPFGRGLLRFELEPLMQAVAAARPRPLLIASVRDIVERRRESVRYDRMAARVERHFDAVLVHSDPSLVPFDDSFPPFERIAARVHYTGYVSDRPAVSRRPACPQGPVLVSAGGGFFGETLLRTAIQAAALALDSARAWRVLVGPNLPEDRFQSLCAAAAGGVTVERNRADFHALLDTCAVSVSQGGYNTVVDLLASRAPAVVVPYEDDREREQAVRARHLAARGLVELVPYAELDPDVLAAAVGVMTHSSMPDLAVDLDGARGSAGVVRRLLDDYR